MSLAGSPSSRIGCEKLVTSPAEILLTKESEIKHKTHTEHTQQQLQQQPTQQRQQQQQQQRSSEAFSLRTRTRIGTWNVRTLHDAPSKLEDLVREFKKVRLEVLGLCEHRWADSGEIRIPNSGISFLFSGKPLAEKRESGVGLMLSASSRSALRSWIPVSDRILTARFRTRARHVTIVQVYAPTNMADSSSKDDFYESLSATLNKVPRGDIQILMGDLNAKVGNDNSHRESVMGKHGLGTANDNGDRFVELCTNHGLVIGGTIFKHKDIHKVTWYSSDGRTMNQIDHISISRKWRKSLLDVRVLRGAEVYTDHKLLVGAIQLKLASIKPKFSTCKRKVDPSKLQSPQCRKQFRNELRKQLETAAPIDPEECWDHLYSSLTTVSEATIPLVPERKKSHISDATWDLIQQRKQADLAVGTARLQVQRLEALEVYNALERRVKTSARNDRRVWLNSIADKAQEAAEKHQTRELYRLTKRLSGKSTIVEKPVKSADGTPITDADLQLERWTDYFSSTLNPQVNSSVSHTARLDLDVVIPQPEIRININAPSLTEVSSAIASISSGKAPGPDGLFIELLKADLETATRYLHSIIGAFWEMGSFPKGWKEALLIKLPKKGDLSLCGNWRGIALQNSISKVIARIVHNRISVVQDSSLRREQAGFRRGRSCTDHINTLRIIVEQYSEFNSPLCLLFVDFKSAFDSVDREMMWQILGMYGIPAKIISIIKQLYCDASLRILHRGRIGTGFGVESGVKQGCILSPLLFNIVLDYTMRRVSSRRKGIPWNVFSRLTDLDYADDIVGITETMLEMQKFLDDLIACARDVGLTVNIAKTKLMRINPSKQTRGSIQVLHIGSEVVEEVDKFVYLGSVISKDGGAEDDVRNRIRLANAAFGSLRNVWTSTRLSRRLKLKVFNSNVKSVLLYSCETWKVTKALTQRIQVFTNKCLRVICGIFYPERISNTRLHVTTQQQPISEEIGRRKWGWIGHTLRKSHDDIARQAIFWNVPGKRSVGRRKVTWRSSVEKEAEQQGKKLAEVAALAQNRIRFKCFINALRFNVEQ
jgi:Reverse transcriptase (RNA-dependent DNA polymerase)/Domain of unknown function (DUF6451)